MPRARVLRPTFWDSPDTAAASLRCRLLYLAMKNWADDYGIGDATKIRVIGFAFPYDNIPAAEYQPLFDEVAAVYGVVFFHHEQRPYYVIPEWNEDQPRERKAKPNSELMKAATQAVAQANLQAKGEIQERPCNCSEAATDSTEGARAEPETSGPQARSDL